MKVLAVESSSVVAGVAIISDDRLLYEGYYHNKKNHSCTLMPMVENALEMSGVNLSDIDVFAVTKGPGSFTGLRIGIATIKGLTIATGKPVAAIPTLDSLCYNIPNFHGIVCPILDARRNQVYACYYKRTQNSNGYERLDDYLALPITELIERLKKHGLPVMFVGDGISPNQEIIKSEMPDCIFAPDYLRHQRASVTARLGIDYYNKGLCIDSAELEPFYLRKSQAEQKLEKSQGNR